MRKAHKKQDKLKINTKPFLFVQNLIQILESVLYSSSLNFAEKRQTNKKTNLRPALSTLHRSNTNKKQT